MAVTLKVLTVSLKTLFFAKSPLPPTSLTYSVFQVTVDSASYANAHPNPHAFNSVAPLISQEAQNL